MNKLFNLFKSNKDKVNEELTENRTEEQLLVDRPISEPLFVSHDPPGAALMAKPEKKSPFAQLVSRDHHAKGYTDGFEYQDPDLLANYKAVLISEGEDMLKDALRELDSMLGEFERFSGREDELTPAIKADLFQQRKAIADKKRDLLDRLEATGEGRGPIFRAIKEYENGFTRGFLDRNASKKLDKVFDY